MREWLTRLADWVRRDARERDLHEELEFHRRQLERAHAEGGASAETARRQARRQLGDAMRITEDARERWSIRWLDHVRQDVRHAVRGLRRTPAFTAAVAVTLALGIGANAAMLAVIDRLLFRPLDGLRAPGEVHRLYFETIDRGRPQSTSWVSSGRYQDVAQSTTSFTAIAAFNERVLAVGSAGAVREMPVIAVSASFFDFFDAPPARGRYFTADEDRRPLGAPVSVLAHAFWQSEFGGRDVVGETLQVGDLVTTIVGVAAPELVGINDAQPPRLFVPITTTGQVMGIPNPQRLAQGYDSFWGHMLVRRAPGVSVDAATVDATEAFRRSWVAQRAAQPRLGSLDDAQPRARVAGVRPGAGPTRSLNTRTALWVAGVSALVLIIAIANVANLWVGRALARRRETAVRLALGVGRARLFSQALTESLLVAVLAAAGGVLIAYWGGAAIYQLLAPTIGGLAATPATGMLDGRAIALIVALTIVVGVLTAIAPALFAFRTSAAPALRTGTRGTVEGMRLRTVLVIAQAALSLILVVGALLFVQSLRAALDAPLGYEPDRVLSVNRTMRGAPLSREALLALRRTLLDAARAHPAVEAAAWRFTTPFGTSAQIAFTVDGVDAVDRLGRFTSQEATADYFKAMGTRIVRGRGFSESDRADTPRVAVVSESMGRTLWPGEDPIGKCMRIGAAPAPCTSVVGIAEDVTLASLTASDHLHFYLNIDQYPERDGSGLFLRMRGDPAAHAESIRQALQPLMPGASYVSVQPLDLLVDRGRQSWRVGATMFVAFGGLALIVAAVGLYGVIGYMAAQRTAEVGVRLALGAPARDIAWLVLRPGVILVVAGVAAGVGLALTASRWFQPLLFQQSATDPAVYSAACVLLLLTGLAASVIPAIRAVRLNPTTVMRAD